MEKDEILTRAAIDLKVGLERLEDEKMKERGEVVNKAEEQAVEWCKKSEAFRNDYAASGQLETLVKMLSSRDKRKSEMFSFKKRFQDFALHGFVKNYKWGSGRRR